MIHTERAAGWLLGTVKGARALKRGKISEASIVRGAFESGLLPSACVPFFRPFDLSGPKGEVGSTWVGKRERERGRHREPKDLSQYTCLCRLLANIARCVWGFVQIQRS